MKKWLLLELRKIFQRLKMRGRVITELFLLLPTAYSHSFYFAVCATVSAFSYIRQGQTFKFSLRQRCRKIFVAI